MVWTSPHTWAAADQPTADATGGVKVPMNLHVKGNMDVLKTSIDDDGKLIALSSSYVADLSGVNLTGLALLASNATYTAVNNFNGGGATRVVLPVGADKFGGAAGNKTAGSWWVELTELHHVSSAQVEWYYIGTVVSTPAGAVAGSVWVDTSDGLIHYVTSAGVERAVGAVITSMHADAAALPGSSWVDTDSHLHWVATGGQEEDGHTDVPAHSDVAHDDTHTDSHDDAHSDDHSDEHSDGAHDDTHDDVSHADSHADQHFDVTDAGHLDSHGDSHNDTAHDDGHVDSAHDDAHADDHDDSHGDSGSTSHTDTAHTDHTDTHGDQPTSLGT
jgi:hypothetical protein